MRHIISFLLLCMLCFSPIGMADEISNLTARAEAGDAMAQNNLGIAYHIGKGVPQDDKQALVWYTKAAEQGYAIAQNNLGVLYRDGKGVPQDDKQALFWFTKAAEQGEEMAQYNLGMMYSNGEGVLQDYVQAHKWLSLSAANGDERQPIKARDQIVNKMTLEQIAEAKRLAREWMKAHQQ